MDCDVITDLMPAYESGYASIQTQQLVEEHLATCQICRAAFGSSSSSQEVATLPTPDQPDERAVLMQIREGLLALWSDAQPSDSRPILVRLREASLNLLAGAPLFLVNALLLLFIYPVGREGQWWPFAPRDLRLGFPLSVLPSVIEMLLLVGILLGLRWMGHRYVYNKPPSLGAALYLAVAWIALL